MMEHVICMQNTEEVQCAAMYICKHLPRSLRRGPTSVCDTGFGKRADMAQCIWSIPFEYLKSNVAFLSAHTERLLRF